MSENKDNSALLVTLDVLKNIVDAINKNGGNYEHLHRLATPEGSETLEAVARLIVCEAKKAVKAIYSVLVDHAMSVEDAIHKGQYDFVNSDITSQNFPTTKCGKEEVEVVLFHFNKNISNDDAIAEMDKAGYRPADLRELLAIGAKYHEIQREFPVIALGSVWRHSDGRRPVAFLFRCDSERSLGLGWIARDWRGRCRFAAVRK